MNFKLWFTKQNYYFVKKLLKLKLHLKSKFTTQSIALAAIMLALTIVIVKLINFNLYLGVGNKGKMVIGFGFLPNVIFSFLHGPFFGFIFGFIIDTTLYILNGGFYSPIMALEKPLVGLIAGLLGVLYCKISQTSFNFKKWLITFIIMQFILGGILVLTLWLLFFSDFFYAFSVKSNKVFSVQWNIVYLIIFAIFIFSLIIIIELILFVILFKTKNKQALIINDRPLNNALIFIIIVLMQLILTLVNSWILTPFHYLVFYEIDFMISLLPRLIKELLLLPLRVFLYFMILKVILKIYYDKYFVKS